MTRTQLLVLGLVGGALVLRGGAHYVASQATSRFPKGNPATLEKINRVKPGMTPAQVEAIFGVPGQVRKGDSPTNPNSISWTNHNLSGVGIIFENGRVAFVVRGGDLPQESGE